MKRIEIIEECISMEYSIMKRFALRRFKLRCRLETMSDENLTNYYYRFLICRKFMNLDKVSTTLTITNIGRKYVNCISNHETIHKVRYGMLEFYRAFVE